MPTTLKVELKGVPEFISNLKAQSVEIQKAVSDDIQKGGLSIERDAKLKAPVDTGALKSSIHYEQTGEFSCNISDGVLYGVFQEYGTSKMRAQPFMRPSVEKNKPVIEEKIARDLRK
jgi:HK97 gp10 family phage protein